MPDTSRYRLLFYPLSDMNHGVLFTSKLQNFMVLQPKCLLSPYYRHADEVWSIQSILLVHQQLGVEDPLLGRFFFDWEASGAAFARFMMGITKVLKLTISSLCGTCDRTQEKLIFTDDDTVTQSSEFFRITGLKKHLIASTFLSPLSHVDTQSTLSL